MIKHQISLQGPNARGSRISGFLLKDLLDVLTDSTKGALRLRIEGRSVAPGADPSWLGKASDFDIVGLEAGSTVINIEAPTLAEAVPEKFAQQSLFQSIDTTASAFKVFEESLEDAINGRVDSELFDEALLERYARLNDIFSEGIDSFVISNGSPRSPRISVTAAHIEKVKTLRRETPAPQATRIAGQINTIRYSDKMFELILESGEALRGVAPTEYDTDKIARFFGENVAVVGKAVFRPSGSILRIEASKIEPFEGNMTLWSKSPKAQRHSLPRDLHRVQGSQSGLNKLWGKWPGSETEEQVKEALQSQ